MLNDYLDFPDAGNSGPITVGTVEYRLLIGSN